MSKSIKQCGYKIFAMFLVASLALGALGVAISQIAFAQGPAPVITGANVEAQAGQANIEVDFAISENPGIGFMGIDVSWGAQLTHVEVLVDGAVLPNAAVVGDAVDTRRVNFFSMTGDVSENGHLFTVRATVADGVAIGTQIPLTLTMFEINSSDFTLNPRATLNNGSIIIIGEPGECGNYPCDCPEPGEPGPCGHYPCECEEITVGPWTVTFNLDGGVYAGSQALLTQTVADGANAAELSANPTRAGFTFTGWSPALNLNNVTADRTFTAQWQPVGGGVGFVPTPPTAPATPPVTPPDVTEIFSVHHNAFLIGRPDGTIAPHATITRAEVATVLFRLLSDEFRAEVWSTENNFIDVAPTAWFNNAISTMANAGIVTDGGAFRPNDAVTRAEFAAMVARFFTEFEAEENVFTDVEGNWAEDYINLIAQFGWVQGAGDGTFNPNANMTRAETAAIVNRMLDRILTGTEGLLEGRTLWSDKTNMNAWYYLYLQEASHSTLSERLEDGTIAWTQILTHLDWTVLERPFATAGDLTTDR